MTLCAHTPLLAAQVISLETWIAIVAVLWLIAMIQATVSFIEGIAFYRYMRAQSDVPSNESFCPAATVIMPCCGLDDALERTVRALAEQNYGDYEVIFTFESDDDPAYDAIGRWAASHSGFRWSRVVAGAAEGRSQKVHNLLAATLSVRPESKAMLFLDSDAIPHKDWMTRLIAPLADANVGASSGFRWYTAGDGIVTGLRSAWNAATISFLHDPRFNFCWGGSTGILLETFRKCGIAESWQGALSDDFQMTRGVRGAGLRVQFVPGCLICCDETATFSQFFRFARRQLMITRICAPRLWRAGFTLAMIFVLGTSAVFFGIIAALIHAQWMLAGVGILGWVLLLGLAKAKALLRQAGVSIFLGPPEWSRRDWAFDVLGAEVLGVLHLVLMVSSSVGSRIVWRNTVYDMVSPDETIIVSRAPAG